MGSAKENQTARAKGDQAQVAKEDKLICPRVVATGRKTQNLDDACVRRRSPAPQFRLVGGRNQSRFSCGYSAEALVSAYVDAF
jgi:hypothetical protein